MGGWRDSSLFSKIIHLKYISFSLPVSSLPGKGLKRCKGRFFSTAAEGWLYSYPQMSSFIHLQRHHAPHRRERHLLAKEGTITKEFSWQILNLRKYWVLLHAAKLGHGTDSFTSPPKEGMLRIIRTPEKSNGFGRVRTRKLGYQWPAR